MKLGKPVRFLVSIVACYIAAGLGSVFTTSQIATWYLSLHKPPFNPPNWIFGPVWTLLYTLMGISLYLVWTTTAQRTKKLKKTAIQYFILQLLFNSLWSIVFFGMHAPLAAFVVIVGLWFSILVTITKFWTINKLAGQLLIPYILWVTFASVLNFAVVLLN